jgi:hypothetical protein
MVCDFWFDYYLLFDCLSLRDVQEDLGFWREGNKG